MSKIINIDNFYMPELDSYRSIRILLPKNYDETTKSYPVIYMHDGHNLFFKETATYGNTWEIPETMKYFYENNLFEGAVIVGIDCNHEGGERWNEYSPWKNGDIADLLPSRMTKDIVLGGKGQKYAEFIINTLKPYIEKNYRVLKDRENTIIAGSSMGGFISLYIGIKYSNIFSKLGVLSPAFFFNKEEMKNFVLNTEALDLKIYMDIGTNETSDKENPNFPMIYLNQAKEINEILKNKYNVKFQIFENAIHSEIEWAKRFPDMIKFFFNF